MESSPYEARVSPSLHEVPIEIFSSFGYRFVGDCQIEVACELFLKDHGEELIRKNLYRNFIIHINSLFDFGLISARTVEKVGEQTRVSQPLFSQYR